MNDEIQYNEKTHLDVPDVGHLKAVQSILLLVLCLSKNGFPL